MNTTAWVYCPVCKNKTRIRLREDTELQNFPLYCPKCRQETLINETTEYYCYQRAGRTDAEPITRKTIPLWLSAFFISIYDDSLPRPTGKEKNVAGQVAFVRSIYISLRRF